MVIIAKVMIVVVVLVLVPLVRHAIGPGRHTLLVVPVAHHYDPGGFATYGATISSVAGFQIADI